MSGAAAGAGARKPRPIRAGRFRVEFDGEVTWSEHAAAVHGYRPGQARPSVALLGGHEHPADRGALAALLDRVRAGEPAAASSYRLLDRAGATRWVTVVAGPVRDRGQVVGAEGMFIDLQQTLNAEQKPLVDEHLARFLDENAERERAAGMLMLVHGVTAAKAREVLHWRAGETGVPVAELARALIDAAGELPVSPATAASPEHQGPGTQPAGSDRGPEPR